MKEAATYLGVSPWTVRQLCHTRMLPFRQRVANGTILLDVHDLDSYIVSNKIAIAPQILTQPVLTRPALGESASEQASCPVAGKTNDKKGQMSGRGRSGFTYHRKGSPYWWIAYRRGGRLIRESSRQTDREKAEDLLRTRQQMVVSGTIDTLGTTLTDLFSLVKSDYKVNDKATLSNVQGRWDNHLSKFFGSILAHQVTAELVGHYTQERLDAGAKPSTVNRELAILRRMYNLGRRARRIIHDQIPYIQLLHEDNVRKGFVEPAQFDKLAAECSNIGLWLRSMLECGYTYGFRVGELQHLLVRQVDFKDKVIRLEVGETKNGEGREVPMTAQVKTLLEACCEGKNDDDHVFTRDGNPIVDYRIAWRKATEAVGLKGLLFHDLRRSAVRVMVRSGLNENIAMSISGHKTREVFSRYNIVSKQDKEEAMKKREAYLADVTKKSSGGADCSHSEHNLSQQQTENQTSGPDKSLTTKVM